MPINNDSHRKLSDFKSMHFNVFLMTSTYNEACSTLRLLTLNNRRKQLTQHFFHQLTHLDGCLFDLLPPKRAISDYMSLPILYVRNSEDKKTPICDSIFFTDVLFGLILLKIFYFCLFSHILSTVL